MPEVSVHNFKGEVVGAEKLSDGIFGVRVKPGAVYQAVVAQAANSRRVLAHAKDRSEVRGGGRKPWKQKGTGRARHGSIRSPIWRGGGITFGPTKERNFSIKINKKARQTALLMCLSDKAKNKKIFLLDNIPPEKFKTRIAYALLQALNLRKSKTAQEKTPSGSNGNASRKEKNVLVILPRAQKGLASAFKNIPRAQTIASNSLNVIDILKHQYLLLTKQSVKEVEEVYGKK